MLTYKAFDLELSGTRISSGPLSWEPGTIVEIFALSAEPTEELLFTLAALISIIQRSAPAEKGRVVRRQLSPDPILEDLASLNGEMLFRLTPKDRARLVGMVFGDPDLFIIGSTVREELYYSFAAVGRPLPELQVLQRYGLYGKSSRRSEYLSGGERHRLNAACVLELDPQLLIIDLSQANLDTGFVEQLVRWLEEARQHRITIVHGLPPGAFPPDTTEQWVLEGGTLRPGAPASSVFPPASFQQQSLETALRVRRKGETILRVEMLQRIKVTEPVRFSLQSGEILQIRGDNGVGKTTMGKILAGIVHPDEIGGTTEPPLVSLNAVLSPQHSERFLLGPSIRDDMPDDDILDLVGIPRHRREDDPRLLSPSKQKLLAAGVALRVAQDIAILDEPTAGMDFSDKILLIHLLNHWPDKSVLIFTHDPAMGKIGRVLTWEDIRP